MKFAAYKFAGGNWLVGFVVAWGVLTCRHTDQQLPERLVTLHLEEWDDYLKHLSREKLGPEIRDLQRMLEETNARLQDIQRRSVGGGLVEIEKLEQARVVGLSARIAALANGSPYDKVGAIIRARDPMMNYPRKVTLLDYFLIGGGSLIAGGGVLLVGLLCLVAVYQLIGRGTQSARRCVGWRRRLTPCV